jgi:hypothetical protein
VSNEISEELRSFIRRNINSVSLLDVLFLLKKDAHRKWTPEEVSHEMRTNPSYAASQLYELTAMKCVSFETPNLFWFDPQETSIRLVDQLEELYNSRRATVINFIYSQPIDSIRNFADAFKMKKD